MIVKRLPDKFWLVVSPSPVSTLGDICFKCDLQQFAVQIRGGLDEQKIVAAFAEEQPAIELAERLLRAADEPWAQTGTFSNPQIALAERVGSPRRSRSKE